ncbi:MAG: hypothetical protein ACQEQV_06505 [Fibrobacterota bacterium]
MIDVQKKAKSLYTLLEECQQLQVARIRSGSEEQAVRFLAWESMDMVERSIFLQDYFGDACAQGAFLNLITVVEENVFTRRICIPVGFKDRWLPVGISTAGFSTDFTLESVWDFRFFIVRGERECPVYYIDFENCRPVLHGLSLFSPSFFTMEIRR